MGTTTWDRYPWDARAEELVDTEGPYCAYAAWQEWAEENWHSGIQDWEARDGLDMIDLFVLCCRAVEQSAALLRKDES